MLWDIGHCDVIVSAGDMITGSGETQVIRLLKETGAHCILGNHEEILIDPYKSQQRVQTRNHQFIMDWYKLHTSWFTEEELEYITSLPKYRYYNIGNKRIYVCHATPDDTWAQKCSDEHSDEHLLSIYGDIDADIVIYGHYHSPHILHIKDKVLINVASVGMRSDGMAQYTIIEEIDGEVEITQKAVSYDTKLENKLDSSVKMPKYIGA